MNKTKDNISKGKIGEDLALEFYLSKGFDLEKRNYRFKKGEIDLIVKNEKLMVFVEVKFRKSTTYGHPEDFVSDQQQQLIVATANQYIEETQWKGNIRFDIIAINGQLEIEWFEDAFY